MAPVGNEVAGSAPVKNRILLDSKCDKCNKVVKNGILCDLCDKWFHFKCAYVLESDLPNENEEWMCPKCQDRECNDVALTTSMDSVNSAEKTVATLNKVIQLLKIDIISLKEENESLKQQVEGVNINKWEVTRKCKASRPNLNVNSLTDFPPLINQFEVLRTLENEVNVKITREQSQETENRPKQSTNDKGRTRPKSIRVQLRSNTTKPVKINIFADSHGRNLKQSLNKAGYDEVCSTVKPSAKFQDVTSECETTTVDNDDFVVFFAGSNDVSRNERKDLRATLRQRLSELRNKNVIVVSLPHRYDLERWSCVNEEVRKANEETEKLCKYFKYAHFVNISNIGNRFHTSHGLHLNRLGKMYVADKIAEIVNSTLERKSICNLTAIPLGYINDGNSTLGVLDTPGNFLDL